MLLQELKTRKEKLRQSIEEKINETHEFVKLHLNIFKNVIYDYIKFDTSMTFKSNIKLFALYRIKLLYDHELRILEDKLHLKTINLNKNAVNKNIDIDTHVESLYCLKELYDRINCPGKIKANEDGLLASVNIKTQIITIKNFDTVLSEKKINLKTDSTNMIDLFDQDFKITIDVEEMKYFILRTKINLFSAKLITLELFELKKLNAYTLCKNFSNISVLIPYPNFLNQKCALYVKMKIDSFIYNLESCYDENTYESIALRGLCISYFFLINPGLIEYIDLDSKKKNPEYYYFAWIKFIKEGK